MEKDGTRNSGWIFTIHEIYERKSIKKLMGTIKIFARSFNEIMKYFFVIFAAFNLHYSWALLNQNTLRNDKKWQYISLATKLQVTLSHLDEEEYKFSGMKGLNSRLDSLECCAPEILKEFWDEKLSSFSVQPGVKRFSVTSTCFALHAITQAPDQYSSIVNFDLAAKEQTNNDKISIRNIVEALLRAGWREDDLFQVPLILDTVLGINQFVGDYDLKRVEPEIVQKVSTLISAVVASRPKRRKGRNQSLSDYLLFRCAKSLLRLHEALSSDCAPLGKDTEHAIFIGGLGQIPVTALGSNLKRDLNLAFASYDELCRQLAYRTAGLASFDVTRLCYSLLTYVMISENLAKSAGYEENIGEGPITIQPPDQKLISASLAAIFAEQRSDGLWNKGQPIYKAFRRSGRNVGNAFVFEVDTVASLLEHVPSHQIRPYVSNLERLLKWIEEHQKVEVLIDFCDTDDGKCFGKPVKGWASHHLSPEQGPDAWSTSQTLICIHRLKKAFVGFMQQDVLYEFKGRYSSRRNSKSWKRLLDTDLGSPFLQDCDTLKCVLKERILDPFMALSGGASENNSYPGPGAAYSSILFGPPGTAKTSICEAVAEYLGWNFLVIDTSAFLADGLNNVASRIPYIFERLQSLEKCVILFDEIEEFCLDRETPGLAMESRMLTTAMLTAINDLRRTRKSIFFLATNRLRSFDSAIIRPGRFDMQLFVGTPNLASRSLQFEQELSRLGVNVDDAKRSSILFQKFLQSVWGKDVMFFNYLEGLQFASSCANIVDKQGVDFLTNETMNSIIESRASVMTIRGLVRDEYIASMELSRW